MKRKNDVIDKHPRHILVSKEKLESQLRMQRVERLILRVLVTDKEHPRFEEWVTKACYRLQLISSFVYVNGYAERKVIKLSVKRYEKMVFDPLCENLEECRELLSSIYRDDLCQTMDPSDEFVERIFEKYCAFKRYVLPMLANTLEFEYFSFYRHILLYVVEHDTYPEFPISSFYMYPLLPGMCECDIDFEY